MTIENRNIIIGVFVTIIGAVTLATPGGWDWLSAINLWMGGMLIGMSYASRLLRR